MEDFKKTYFGLVAKKLSRMNYQTYNPSPLLAPLVKCFWSLEFPATPEPEKQVIVPDGCMELIIHYGDLYQQFLADGSSLIQPRSFVFGQISDTLEIAPTGYTGMIAARFHPDGFTPLASIPLVDMENRAVDLVELFGEEGRQLEQAVLAVEENDQRIQLIEAFLLSRLQRSEVVDQAVKSCVEILLREDGQLKIEDLAIQLHTQRRQLERKFKTAIGLSPKQLSKIIRLQSTLKQMYEQEGLNLTEFAYQNGYFDQSHFIKDFKEFTGTNPKQFYAQHLKLSTLFIVIP